MLTFVMNERNEASVAIKLDAHGKIKLHDDVGLIGRMVKANALPCVDPQGTLNEAKLVNQLVTALLNLQKPKAVKATK